MGDLFVCKGSESTRQRIHGNTIRCWIMVELTTNGSILDVLVRVDIFYERLPHVDLGGRMPSLSRERFSCYSWSRKVRTHSLVDHLYLSLFHRYIIGAQDSLSSSCVRAHKIMRVHTIPPLLDTCRCRRSRDASSNCVPDTITDVESPHRTSETRHAPIIIIP